MGFDLSGWLGEWANYVKDAILKMPTWDTAYNRSPVNFSLGTMPDGKTALVITSENGSTLQAPVGEVLVGKPEGLASPLGIITFDENTNIATITLPFIVNVNGLSVTTPVAPNNTVLLGEKDNVFSRFDLVTFNTVTKIYDYFQGIGSNSSEVPNTPVNHIKLAEIFRPVTGPFIIQPTDLTEYYKNSGGKISGQVILIKGVNLHLRGGAPGSPDTSAGDIIAGTFAGVETHRLIAYPSGKWQVKYNGDNSQRGTVVDTTHYETLIFTGSTGIVIIDFNVENRLMYYPKRNIEVYNTDGDNDISVINFGKSYNRITRILTLDGIFGNGYLILS